MSNHFSYHDDWQSVELECPKCHWKGKFNDCSVGYYRELMDASCPNCDFLDAPILAIVSYPTLDEMTASGRLDAVQEAERIRGFTRELDAAKLRDKVQLPDIDAPTFSLTWDFVEKGEQRLTAIRYGDRVLFSEPARWEGYRRFEEVCEIVRARYGERVLDLVPTPASELYLFGDASTSEAFVSRVRRNFFRPEAT